ncbi:MAG: LPXTG cell wall anchor domain-containing protein [Propionibacteriaceae bacterium]|nr:LPXTG cell wall anchor domain-containing protein [Propionibacteriaceae bacterium]
MYVAPTDNAAEPDRIRKAHMHHILRRTAIAALTLATLAVLPAPAARADDDRAGDTTTWMVRPSDGVSEDGRSWIERELDPGQTVTENLLVRNLSPFPVTFHLAGADGYFTQTGRFNMLTSGQESVDAGTWIDIQDTVEVASGADAIVPFTIEVPDNATPGDHPAGVAASVRSGDSEEVGIESRVGFRVMIRVTGEIEPGVDADLAGTYAGSWNPFDPGRLDLTYTVTNTGNTRLAITPRLGASAPLGIAAFGATGEEIAEIAPGESRSDTVSIPSVWPLFFYTADLVVEAAPVSADLPIGGIAPATVTLGVAAVPWPQLVTIAIAVLLIWLLRRDRRRRHRQLALLVEKARQEGREEGTRGTVLRQRARFGIGAAVTTAIVFALGGHATAFAATDNELESRSVTIQVEISPRPAPSPTPEPTSPGELPTTGAGDPWSLTIGAMALVALGAVTLAVRRRRPTR